MKFTWNNIKEKKLRTLLILFSVIVSTALYFGSMGLSHTVTQTYTDFLSKYYGSAELMIYPDRHSPSNTISDQTLDRYRDQLEYAIGVMQAGAVYKPGIDESVAFSVLGYDYGELQQMHTLSLDAHANLEPFRGRKVIISRLMADRYNLTPGDSISLEIMQQQVRFEVVAVANPVGLFLEDGRINYALVPKEFLNTLAGVRNSSSVIYIKMKDPGQKSAFFKQVAHDLPRYTMAETINQEAIKNYTRNLTQPFAMMILVVIIISVFIIYNSFKLIALERIPVIGTFRSIGATRRMINLVFLGESLVYGLIGGLLGCLLGIGVLQLMTAATTANLAEGMSARLVFTPLHLASSFCLALGLSVFSAYLPIWRVARLPLKDIILNHLTPSTGTRYYKYYMGALFVLASIILPRLAGGAGTVPAVGAAIVLNIVGIILLVPVIIGGLGRVLEKVYPLFFGNEGLLAVKNIKQDQNVKNNVILLYIGISSIILIKIVSVSVMTEVTAFFRDWQFELMASPPQASRSMEGSLRSVPGVTDVYGALTVGEVEIAGTNYRINQVEGINHRFFDFMNVEVSGDRHALIEELAAGRNILVSNHIRDQLQLQKGQVIHLETPRGTLPYTVTGFLDTIENMGQYALISDRNMKMDMEQRYYSVFYIKAHAPPELVKAEIDKRFSRNPFWVETVENIEKRNEDINKQLFLMLDGFSYMIVVIGLFGILNNIMISFLERRRSLAIYRSIGMSRKQTMQVLTLEAFTAAFIAGLIGIAGSLMSIAIIQTLLRGMGLKGDMMLEPGIFITVFFLALLLVLLSSLSPSLRAARSSIVEAIKYD